MLRSDAMKKGEWIIRAIICSIIGAVFVILFAGEMDEIRRRHPPTPREQADDRIEVIKKKKAKEKAKAERERERRGR